MATLARPMHPVTVRASEATPLAGAGGASRVAPANGFRQLAWGTLGFVLFVILFGAVVRITGSGAGCGQHWPSCHGEITHLPRTMETAIELTHRVTSALSGPPVLALVVLAFRRLGRGHLVRKAALLSLVFLIIEALIGAVLVRRGLVEQNASPLRALVMSLHLVNTSLLTAALAITAWGSTRGVAAPRAPRTVTSWLLALALGAALAVSMTGAVTALGDTLYPAAGSGLDTVRADHASAELIRQLRFVHPVLAVVTGVFLMYLPFRVREGAAGQGLHFWANGVFVLAVVQLMAGVVNIWLSAPGWMQVLHLALANLLWIALVLTTAEYASRLELTPRTADPA